METNKIYCADVMDFIPRLDDRSIDLAIIDPPYNMNKCGWDKFADESDYFDFTFKWLDLTLPKLKDDSSVYLFNTAYNSAIILSHLRGGELTFKNWITWYKKDGFSASRKKYTNAQETILFLTKGRFYTFNYNDIRVPYLSTDRIASAVKKGILKNGKRWFPNENGRLCSDVWEIASQRHREKVKGKVQKPIHPTVKPYDMIKRMIKASSNEGDLVLDLFSGSGMTSIVSRDLNRNFIGCELESEYIAHIESEGMEIGRL